MERLGVTGQEASDLPLEPWYAPRPKRMRWATCERIVQQAAAVRPAAFGMGEAMT
jgi:hypothetical protein